MRRPQGYATFSSPDAPVIERDTASCGHCNRVVFVKPGTASTVYLFPQMQGPDKEEPGAMCRVCMRAICLACCAQGSCTPLERRIEQMEARRRMLRAIGLGLVLAVLAPSSAWAQFIAGDRLTGTSPPAGVGVLFREDFSNPNALGTNRYNFDFFWPQTGGDCRYQGVDEPTCPVQAYTFTHLPTGGLGGGGAAQITMTAGVGQRTIGWTIDLPANTPTTQGSTLYGGFAIKYGASSRFRQYNNGTGKMENKFIIGPGSNDRVMILQHAPVDNQRCTLSSFDPLFPNLNEPNDYGLTGTDWHAAAIDDQYGSFSVGKEETGYECAGPALVTYPGNTLAPSDGWYRIQWAVTCSSTSSADDARFRLWVNNGNVNSPTLDVQAPIGAPSGSSAFDCADWAGQWNVGGYWTNEPNADFTFILDNVQFTSAFDTTFHSQ